jgi:hypothetical protein
MKNVGASLSETDLLRSIRRDYGAFLEASAARYKHREEVLAGIMMRETLGGGSPFLDQPGPAGRGDHGHGHGLMQIDDRSFPEFCGGEDWKDPAKNIDFGAKVLQGKRNYLFNETFKISLKDYNLERASIAAYNAGEGRVLKSLLQGEDVDTHTAHGNYSAEVLRFASVYKNLEE